MKLLAWLSKKEREKKRQIKMIAASSYFDAEWYYRHYPDVEDSGIEAAKHYLMFGWKESRNPGPYFDTDDYLRVHPELLSYGINPLIHFIVASEDDVERQDTSFNIESFARRYSEFVNDKNNSNIFIKKILSAKKDQTVLADDEKVDKNYQLVSNSGFFNKKWYAKRYLLGQNVDPIEHYLQEGWVNGYNPSKKFDTKFYLSKYPDIARAGINPLLHYLQKGKNEGRQPKAPKLSLWQRISTGNKLANKSTEYRAIYQSGLFDEKWYLKQYPEVSEIGKEPLQHYLEIGWKESKNPSEKFDTIFYLKNNPDILRAGVNPLRHYVLFGKNEGRTCLPPYRKVGSKATCKADYEQNPKISVLVASYNYEQFIGETLDSLVKQTYKNFEVVVVDDGSKDNSVKLIKKYVKKYPNVFLYRHENGENRGLVKTIKLGLEKATGKYVAFCESDDYWLPNNLEEKVKIINEYHSPKIIYNNVKLFGPGQKKQEEYIANLSLIGEGLYEADPIPMTYNIIPTFSCVMIDRKVLMDCDFDAYIPAWTDWWLYRQIFAQYPIYHVDKALSMWRIHDSYNSEKKAAKYMEKFDEFVFYNNELITEKNKKYIAEIYKDNHIKMLLNSDLFDEKYYVKHYPDVKKFSLPPVYHYLKVGWKLGYNPSAKFDTKAYLSSYADVMKNNPLIHYLTSGKKEHRSIYEVNENHVGLTSEFVEKVRNSSKSKKSILLFNHELTLTGAPRALLNMALSLRKQGYYPVIISWKDGPMAEEIEKSGIDAVLDIYLYSKLKNEDTLYKEFFELFDIMLFNTIVSLRFWNCLPQVPAKKIVWSHEGSMGYDTYAKVLGLQDVFNKLDKVYSVGRYSKSFAEPYIEDKEKSKMLLYGIEDMNLDMYKTTKPQDADKVKFILPGAICERKGHDILLKALDIIPNEIKEKMLLYFAGPASDKKIDDDLTARARKEKYIKYLGSVPHGELMKLYANIDVILCPSRDDPMPIVCTEAFILEKTVIVSEHTGTAGFIENEKNGFLIPSEDVKALADAMIYVVNNRDKLPDIGKKSRSIYDEYFTLEKFDESVKSIMEDEDFVISDKQKAS